MRECGSGMGLARGFLILFACSAGSRGFARAQSRAALRSGAPSTQPARANGERSLSKGAPHAQNLPSHSLFRRRSRAVHWSHCAPCVLISRLWFDEANQSTDDAMK